MKQGWNDYDTWLQECDKIVSSKIGLSLHDLPDANWGDYHSDGQTPSDAVQCAYDDYWQIDFQFMGINEDFGVWR
tara:strand:- start:175 stop:399 length:225 start_codon:yes stop_codon:yes gene_type:complete